MVTLCRRLRVTITRSAEKAELSTCMSSTCTDGSELGVGHGKIRSADTVSETAFLKFR
jgi:hypothetical protein